MTVPARLAVIGYGTIVKLALRTLAREMTEAMDVIAILARPGGEERARAMLEECAPRLAHQSLVTSDLAAIIATRPTLAVEAAGHAALIANGAQVLAAGVDLLISSVGALADDDLRQDLDEAAKRSGARLEMAPGAIGGLDMLAAAKLAGLERVIYTGRKPPAAWRGTRAQEYLDLDRLTSEALIFEGSAGEAARAFPQNANVAATLALAGAGFAQTRVRLIADPGIERNVHEIAVRSASADFTVRIEGRVAPDNPKTSLTVAYSLASTILRRLKP